MPGGRPYAITKEKEKQIVECFSDGLTDEETALFVGVSYKSIQRIRHGELCPAIKKATLGKKMIYLRRLRDGKRPDWPRIAWYLERTYPKEFCKPEVALAITNNVLSQVNVQALTIHVDGANRINSRVKGSDERIDKLLKARSVSGEVVNGNGETNGADLKSKD